MQRTNVRRLGSELIPDATGTAGALLCEKCGNQTRREEPPPENTDPIRIERDIARLDLQWQSERLKYLIRQKRREPIEPTEFSWVGGAVCLLFGFLIFASGVSSTKDRWTTIIPGLLLCCFSIRAIEWHCSNFERFRIAREAYEARSARLQAEAVRARVQAGTTAKERSRKFAISPPCQNSTESYSPRPYV